MIMHTALVGYGGVGKAFEQLLLDKRDYLRSIGLNLSLDRIVNSKGPDFGEILAQGGFDLLVLTTPTNIVDGEPGYAYIKQALQHGLHVVTADKGPIVRAYHELRRLAAQNGVTLGIGCTTGGALPAINGGLIDLAGARISRIEGVLNGTSNYILEQMRQGLSYAEALQEAQQQGIAETDPRLDVEGWDTACKLLILVNAVLDEQQTLADINVRGITDLTPADMQAAARQGLRYRLVGQAAYQNGQLRMSVVPQALDADHPFYLAEGSNKAVRYVSDTLGELTLAGGGGGTRAAAASLLRDIINITR